MVIKKKQFWMVKDAGKVDSLICFKPSVFHFVPLSLPSGQNNSIFTNVKMYMLPGRERAGPWNSLFQN